MEFITTADVRDFISAGTTDSMISTMIEDAVSDATRVAPCLSTLDDLVSGAQLGQIAGQVKSILRAALIRWGESGSGAVQTQQRAVGPWSQATTIDSRQERRGMFWPTEIVALEKICQGLTGGASTRASSIDQIVQNAVAENHQPWCSITWGSWCSCGAYLTAGRHPLYEGGAIS